MDPDATLSMTDYNHDADLPVMTIDSARQLVMDDLAANWDGLHLLGYQGAGGPQPGRPWLDLPAGHYFLAYLHSPDGPTVAYRVNPDGTVDSEYRS